MTLPDDLYLRVRKKEGRLYSDDIVIRLPEVPVGHPLRDEWIARAASLRRLAEYVAHLPRPLRILELGCGNGWLSHQLSAIPATQIWGLDLYSSELKQAAHLFTDARTAFLAADIFHAPFAPASFDLIIVASAIQYFPDLPGLLRELLKLRSRRGELHILDSPLYNAPDVPAARERTRAYYSALGIPEMAGQYFHHTLGELDEFAPRWLYRPHSATARIGKLLGKGDSPFPWLCIRASSATAR